MVLSLSQRRTELITIAMLLIAVLILFAPVLRHPNVLLYPTYSAHSDLTVSHWPKAYLMAQTWETTRSLPSWTPANLSGMPLAAHQVAMRFYPPAWLFLFLPLNPVFNLLYVLHLFWGGLGIYSLLRIGYRLDYIPALVGALTFALGGKLLADLRAEDRQHDRLTDDQADEGGHGEADHEVHRLGPGLLLLARHRVVGGQWAVVETAHDPAVEVEHDRAPEQAHRQVERPVPGREDQRQRHRERGARPAGGGSGA